MKVRPILFSGAMVRALLDGSKTQTRRVVKPQFAADAIPAEMGATNERGHQIAGHSGMWWCDAEGNHEKAIRCPYGKPGDRLWVRETWQGPLLQEFEMDADADWYTTSHIHQYQNPAHCEYAADGGPKPEYTDTDDIMRQGWRPSIHMPRWASRITLEVTAVRVERLQGISEADALAEGLCRLPPPPAPHEWTGPNRFTLKGMGKGVCSGSVSWNAPTAKDLYRRLWEQINGPDSWSANPWVWAVEFRRQP